MQTGHRSSACCDHALPRGHRAARLLLWVLLGTAFVLNAFLASWIYPDNPLAGDLSAAVGALMLAAPILWNAARDLLRGHVHMDELVALAVLAALAQGDFRTAGIIAFFMLISNVIETRTAEGAHAAIEGLVRLTPAVGRRLRPDQAEEEVPADQLRPGDRIRLRPGDAVPADARLLTGRTTLEESTVTGESLPAEKGPGDDIFAGTMNLTGAVEAEVLRAGADTTLGRVRELILAAEHTRLPFTRMIDRYAGYYTPVVLALAGFVWFFTGDWQRVVAMLVMACPCALILATPTAMVAALSAAARMGVLIKNVADLEAFASIDAFVFDKTGTLTTGHLGVTRLVPEPDVRPSELLAAACAAEHFSKHPVAVALARLAKESGLAIADPTEFHEEAGLGVRGRLADGAWALAGRPAWLAQNGIALPASAAEPIEEGSSVIHVASGGRFLGRIALRDEVRPEAAGALAELKEAGARRIAMVTGDRATVAARVAAEVDSHEVRAECLPHQKVEFVKAVRAEGYRVAVVGDGVNDAPALAAGDIGIALGAAGSEVALHSATVALMNNDLRRVPFLMRLSKSARGVVVQNIGAGILFIVGGLFLGGAGQITPILAAVLHNIGSLIVVFNSGRLIRAGDAPAR